MWLDKYERRARLLPALLAVLPLVALAVALGVREWVLGMSIVGLAVAAGGSVVLASLVRDKGKQLEQELWRKWGGPPTTLLLQDGGEAPIRRQGRRLGVESLTGRPLPTLDEERRDPDAAAQRYEQAAAELRALAGSRRLAYVENVNYGFSRNSLAIGSWGQMAAALSLLAVVLAVITGRSIEVPYEILELALVGLVSLVMLAFWIWFPTEQRVRAAGFRYAEQLIDVATSGRS